MGMDRKAYTPFELKAVDEDARTFSGLASTWDVDLDGDRIQKGAFKKSLNDWQGSSGRQVVPLIDQHNYSSGRAVIGKMVDASETDDGLEAKFQVINTAEERTITDDERKGLEEVKSEIDRLLEAASRAADRPTIPPEIESLEKELADVVAMKELAIADEDYDTAALLRDQQRGLEARLARKRKEHEQASRAVPLGAPDEPGRLRAEAFVASLRAREAEEATAA